MKANGLPGDGENQALAGIARFILGLNDLPQQGTREFRDVLLGRLAEHLNCKALLFYWPKVEGNLVWLDVLGTAGPEAGRVHSTRVARGDELAGKAFSLKEGRLISRISLATSDAQKAIRTYKPDAQTVMCVPVIQNKQAIAVFEVYDRVDGHFFSPEDLQGFALLTRFLIPHLHFLEVSGRSDQERSHLDRLTQIAQQIGLQRNPDTLLPLIEGLSRELSHGDASALFLMDEDVQELRAVSLPKHRIPSGEGVAGKAAWDGEPRFVAHIQADATYLAQLDAPFGIHMKSLAAIPLRSEDKTLGVLLLANPKSIEDINLQQSLKAFAATAAVAVQNSQLFGEVTALFLSSIEALAEAIDAKDPYTHGHSARVRDFSMAIGRRAVTDPKLLRQLELSAILHDVGKIGTREEILNKRARLSEQEFAHIKEHVVNGARILQNIPQMKEMIDGVLYHHERYDGSGYPKGLKGAEIPLFGRIIAIADTFDAMTSDRPYRVGLEDEVAIFEIKKHSGIHFDPRLVEAFLRAYESGEVIRQSKRETDEPPRPAPGADHGS